MNNLHLYLWTWEQASVVEKSTSLRHILHSWWSINETFHRLQQFISVLILPQASKLTTPWMKGPRNKMREEIFSLPSLTSCTNSQSHDDCLHHDKQQHSNDKHYKAVMNLLRLLEMPGTGHCYWILSQALSFVFWGQTVEILKGLAKPSIYSQLKTVSLHPFVLMGKGSRSKALPLGCPPPFCSQGW